MSESQRHFNIVALVGAPNSGKTTLYNWLTNSHFKTVNYPGATVEYALGSLAAHLGEPFLVMDTPGTYSLFPKSVDEVVTWRALYENQDAGSVGKVIVVCDGTQMDRHLVLAEQIQEAGFTMVLAVTMKDLLQKSQAQIQVEVLKKHFHCDVILFDGRLGGGLHELVEAVRKVPPRKPKTLASWTTEQVATKTVELQKLTTKVFKYPEKLRDIYENTVWWDRYFLHHVWGLPLFFLIMATLFTSIFWLASPLMRAVDIGFSWLADQILALDPAAIWTQFLAKGLVSSFSAVMVFVPQIFILFFGIGILEGTGYLARAATLIDKPFSKVGLTGRSFVPLLSGFACAVPAMLAARNISSARDRWITNFVIPLMTCSARLPVYALLLSFVFQQNPSWRAGVSLAGLYFASLIVGAVAAAILNRILAKSSSSFLMMELPLYRRPRLRVLLRQAFTRTQSYVKRAGPVIFTFAVLIWLGTNFPNYHLQDPQQKLQTSFFGQMGHRIEPVFEPMGVDWRVGVGLLSAFAAREVFVSSMAVIFNVTAETKEGQTQGLLRAMSEAKMPNGAAVFSLASVMALIVFFMIALQCMSTFGTAVKESGSLRFALTQLVVFNVVAYILAVAVFRVFSYIN